MQNTILRRLRLLLLIWIVTFSLMGVVGGLTVAGAGTAHAATSQAHQFHSLMRPHAESDLCGEPGSEGSGAGYGPCTGASGIGGAPDDPGGGGGGGTVEGEGGGTGDKANGGAPDPCPLCTGAGSTVEENLPSGIFTIPAGHMMEEYTTIDGAKFQYDPETGRMEEVTTNAQGTTRRLVDPHQDAQTYNKVLDDLDDDPNSEPTRALVGTVRTTSKTDLYRWGNASGLKVLPRIGKDIAPDENNMIYPGRGGISTFESMNRPAKWWRLPSGTRLPDGLQFRNDKGGHWEIEPSRPMTVDQFRQLLQQIKGWEPIQYIPPRVR